MLFNSRSSLSLINDNEVLSDNLSAALRAKATSGFPGNTSLVWAWESEGLCAQVLLRVIAAHCSCLREKEENQRRHRDNWAEKVCLTEALLWRATSSCNQPLTETDCTSSRPDVNACVCLNHRVPFLVLNMQEYQEMMKRNSKRVKH